MARRARRAMPALVAALALFGAGAWVADATARDLATRHDLHRAAYVGSGACRRCHQDHQASWRRTFHRTMTQEASPEAVLGAFARGAQAGRLDYFGVGARMERAGDAFFVEVAGQRARVARTVGSRRYQQYLADVGGGVLMRLPIAWHVEEQRFIHMNGAFLTPDPDPARAVSADDYARHVVRWNDNCVFCHNVAPRPRPLGGGDRFATDVAELGVACEACHGPGGAHVRANASPVRRYALHLGQGPDPTIVNPARLSAARSAQICGRCHGQRIAADVGRFMRDGDPFVPGDDLRRYTSPLWRQTPLRGEPHVFAPRFWRDGTARLSAYEYQGLLQSPCARAGALTCTTCHGMHEGDPRGQLRPEREGDGACTECHEEIAADVAAHTRHDAAGAGSRCVSCHMPRIVYGLIDVLRSHRIESPDPARDAANGRPDACTLCHVDETRAWAVAERARLFGAQNAAPDAGTRAPSEAMRALAGGDPIERAVAARALGDATVGARGARLGALLDAMEHDPYPAVRWIAWRSARRLAGASRESGPWKAFDATGLPGARRAQIRAIERALVAAHGAAAVVRPDAERMAALRAVAAQTAIEIGE